jgi:2-polyprenyl-3-methyl-5-hydroxy-6-metoxy-1,4-benzoquinol methylase
VSSARAIRVDRSRLAAAAAVVPAAERDEMAVPSYCHPNPAIRWLFWSRLDTALALARVTPGERVLDFGTGGGVLLPTLCAAGARVTASDVELRPARTLVAERALGVELLAAPDQPAWLASHAGSVDCIFALDVLEHVDDADLGRLSLEFRRLLSARGRLVVSGPTETRLYDLARRLSGFQNAYHHRTVYDIDGTLRRDWIPDASRTLPSRPLPRAFVVTRYVPRPA